MTYSASTARASPGADQPLELPEIRYLSLFVWEAIPHLGSFKLERFVTSGRRMVIKDSPSESIFIYIQSILSHYGLPSVFE